MTKIGKKVGLRVAYEAFPDRAYTPDGTLVSRRQPGAVIKDPELVAQRAMMMAKEGMVEAIDGTTVPFRPETLCVHGDTPGAVNLVRKIRETLTASGVEVLPLSKFI
ncbi:MAG: LamB/YcsF family protein [Deltaproteobacteria bacterium]|nr:LamB/YcsF family protein [Deltaproteobacteria bacterium]